MTLREVIGPDSAPEKAVDHWRMQLNADPDFNGPEGRLAHLGIMVEDLEAVLREAQTWGVEELPMGRIWLALPGWP